MSVQAVMEARLAAILASAPPEGRSFRTVAHSPLFDGLQGLAEQGRAQLTVVETRPGRYTLTARLSTPEEKP